MKTFLVGLSTLTYGATPAADCVILEAEDSTAAVKAYCRMSNTRKWGDTWKPVASEIDKSRLAAGYCIEKIENVGPCFYCLCDSDTLRIVGDYDSEREAIAASWMDKVGVRS